jgi:anti-anti-sigma factor
VSAGFDERRLAPRGPVAAFPAPGLAARCYPAGGHTVLELAGEIDEASVPELRFRLAAAIDASGAGARVVVDLTGVTFMDCAGVGELVRALRSTGRAPGAIRLSSPAPLVRRVLDLTGAGSVLPVYDTVEDALGHAR